MKLAKNGEYLHAWLRSPDGGGFRFHGVCVDVLQTEADLIDKYYCPACVAKGLGKAPARLPRQKAAAMDVRADAARPTRPALSSIGNGSAAVPEPTTPVRPKRKYSELECDLNGYSNPVDVAMVKAAIAGRRLTATRREILGQQMRWRHHDMCGSSSLPLASQLAEEDADSDTTIDAEWVPPPNMPVGPFTEDRDPDEAARTLLMFRKAAS